MQPVAGQPPFTAPQPSPAVLNASGDITQEQRREFIRSHRFHPMLRPWVIGATWIIGIAVAFSANIHEQNPDMFIAAPLFVALTVCFALIGPFGNFFLRLYARIRIPTVQPIESVVGTVAYEGRGKRRYDFVIRAEQRRLLPVSNSTDYPRYGIYTLYVVRGTRWVVNAIYEQPLFSDSEYAEQLRAACGFDFDALPSNRDGLLTTRQRLDLLGSGMIGLPVSLIVTIGVSVAIVSGNAGVDGNGLWASLLCVGAFGLVAGLLIISQVNKIRDAVRGNVLKIEGMVGRKFYSDDESHQRRFYYTVDRLRFEVPGLAYNLLYQDRKHRIYYTPSRKKMVNIELL